MSKMINRSTSESPEEGPSVKHLTGRLSSDALERRRVLLTSLGKGSVVIAAASAPLKLLAGQTTIGTDANGAGQRCSVSGQQSGVHSQTVGGAVCTAHSPGYWHKCDHWTSSQFSTLIGTTANPDYKTFKDIFGSVKSIASSTTMVALIQCIGGPSSSNAGCGWPSNVPTASGVNDTDEWHWACAWMNAKAAENIEAGMLNFPYTSAQVVEFYQNKGTAPADKALTFFKSIEGAGYGGPNSGK